MDKQKIGIISTYYNSTNYGGLLQSYALVSFLDSHGYDACQISFDKRQSKIGYAVSKHGISWILTKTFATMKNKAASMKTRALAKIKKQDNYIAQRRAAIKPFREQRIKHTNEVYDVTNIKSCDGFDGYICGSDQIWGDNLNEGFWLSFVPAEKKKLSYAASCTQPDSLLKVSDKVAAALADYDGISVRENNTREILEKISHREVLWAVDPTFLLTRREWERVSKENPFSGEKYIFTYLIGDSRKYRELAVKLSRKTGLKIINIPYLLNQYRPCDEKFGDIKIGGVSPDMWLSLIKDARFVITDSFHGTVFSVIFKKDFFTCIRHKDSDKQSMNNRIYSLLDRLGLNDRVIDESVELDDLYQRMIVDYKGVEETLNEWISESEAFLLGRLEQ